MNNMIKSTIQTIGSVAIFSGLVSTALYFSISDYWPMSLGLLLFGAGVAIHFTLHYGITSEENFDLKLQLALQELKSAGLDSYAWHVRKIQSFFSKKTRPPYYKSFMENAVSLGLFFGSLWGLLTWFLFWSSQSIPGYGVVVSSIIAGVLFGLTMAWHYRRTASKHHLTRWEEFEA